MERQSLRSPNGDDRRRRGIVKPDDLDRRSKRPFPFLVAMDHQGHQNRKGRVVAQPKERPVWTGVFPDGDLPPQR